MEWVGWPQFRAHMDTGGSLDGATVRLDGVERRVEAWSTFPVGMEPCVFLSGLEDEVAASRCEWRL